MSDYPNDLFDVVGEIHQYDVTSIADIGNHGSVVSNVIDNDKYMIV